jgi:hypothetical protein
MKRIPSALSVMTLAVLLLCALFSEPAAALDVTIELLNPPAEEPLVLAVGESYTFEVLIESDDPFIMAMAMPDAYYPGRGVAWRRNDKAHHATSALLHLTMTAKKPTDDLLAVCDWPEPGYCWPDGVAPISIVAGARYKKGVVASEQFPFAVVVVP